MFPDEYKLLSVLFESLDRKCQVILVQVTGIRLVRCFLSRYGLPARLQYPHTPSGLGMISRPCQTQGEQVLAWFLIVRYSGARPVAPSILRLTISLLDKHALCFVKLWERATSTAKREKCVQEKTCCTTLHELMGPAGCETSNTHIFPISNDCLGAVDTEWLSTE